MAAGFDQRKRWRHNLDKASLSRSLYAPRHRASIFGDLAGFVADFLIYNKCDP